MTQRGVASVPVTGLRLRVVKNRANDRLLFGQAETTFASGDGEVLHRFESGQMFGFVRWRGDQYGTQTWRVAVVQALSPGGTGTVIPGVEPGADVLLHAFGKVSAKRALRAIDQLSERHVLHEISPAYWRHVHLCVERGVIPDPYDEEAFRLRAAAGLSS